MPSPTVSPTLEDRPATRSQAEPRAVPRPIRLARLYSFKRAWYEIGRSQVIPYEDYLRLKRAVDFMLALVSLPVVVPVLLLASVLIKLESRGPVFFTQVRTGKGGRTFRMFKLRTMFPNAEELKERYQHLNELQFPDFKIRDDPRVTRVGRILRKTSLDELPQVFNILRGEMSVVGPRPTSFSAKKYTLWHTARLELKPGLTGLWQVLGRNELEFDERVRLDIAYLRNQSLKLDFAIILRTFMAVFSARGAN